MATDIVVNVRKDLSILRDRRFGLLFAARTASVLGSAFGPVALAFGVLALPGATATTLSVVVAAEAIDHPRRHVVDGDVGRNRRAASRQRLEYQRRDEPRQPRTPLLILGFWDAAGGVGSGGGD